MDRRTRRRLHRLVASERELAAEALIHDYDALPHLRRIEAAEKLLAEHTPWHADAWIAFAVAGLTALLVGLLLVLRVRDTPIHFAGRADAIAISLPQGIRWSSSPQEELRMSRIEGIATLWLPAQPASIHDTSCGLSLSNQGADVRVVEIVAKGASWLTFRPIPTGFEVQTQGAPYDVRLSGETSPAPVGWRSGFSGKVTVVDVADEFVRLRTACGGSSLALDGETIDFDSLPIEKIAFLRRGAEGAQVGRHVSSFLGGSVTFFDVGTEANTLRHGEQIWIEKPRGRMTIRREGEHLLLTFDGRVEKLALGPDQRSANPSRLAYMKNNQQIVMAGWALAAIWGFLWSTRKLLIR